MKKRMLITVLGVFGLACFLMLFYRTQPASNVGDNVALAIGKQDKGAPAIKQDVSVGHLKEKYGENYYIQEDLIDIYNKTSERCPRNIHIYYKKDPGTHSSFSPAPRFKVWRPAYVGLENIYLAVNEPKVVTYGNNSVLEDTQPLTKELWLAAGLSDDDFNYITPDFLKKPVTEAIEQELAYCILDPQNRSVNIIEAPIHDDINKDGNLTISVQPYLWITTGRYGVRIVIRKYLPRWSEYLSWNFCESEACEDLSPIYNYLLFKEEEHWNYYMSLRVPSKVFEGYTVWAPDEPRGVGSSIERYKSILK